MVYKNESYEEPKRIYGKKYNNSMEYGFKENLEKISKQPISIEDELYRIRKERERLTISRQSMPRMENEDFNSLKIKSEKVVGNLFDRVRFLETRIKEIEESISIRKKLHEQIVSEIESEIEDKERLADALSDVNERRNLKLDVSVLRKEKRHELVQFWKDITELTIELRQLKEEYETERKIAELFDFERVVE